ncbi:MAG: hypothetical protein EBY13_03755 [Actinobacteria bacterium]|jgi:hypothetical protein|nr:hypothetical protein [Actinomycetota bacterium]NDH12994.1 hypothetical protein [Actinomycetota bacterium]
MNPLLYFRLAGYTLFAVGFLNWRYQTGASSVAIHSAIIILTGVLILVLSFLPSTSKSLLKKPLKQIIWVLFIGVLIYGIVN